MAHDYPDFKNFKRLLDESRSGGANLVPMYRQLLSDQLTPVLAYRRLVQPDDRMAPSFLFESVVGGDRVGRYSFIGAQPVAEVMAYDHRVEYVDHRDGSQSRTFESPDPLAEMSKLQDNLRLARLEGLPDFTGGWVGYAGYDTVRYLEGDKLAAPPPDDRHLPDLHMQLYNDVVAFDHVKKVILVITHLRADEYPDAQQAYDAGRQKLDMLVARLHTPVNKAAGQELLMGEIDLKSPAPSLPTSNMGENGYRQAVNKVKEFVAAGDVFQVVPSQRFEVRTPVDPFDVYRALRVVNPSPYMFYLQIRGGMLVGSSPEILCRVEGRKLVNRPLAGTRKRGADQAEDAALERELLADPKDRAEHIMLVDLARNDVGRVAEAGTVELPALMVVERYSHVMHISSTVEAQLQQGRDCWDALRYSLPVGTVSGAPKVRAMQIIDQLEPTRRGPYGGAVGYVDFAGNMDMAIALRTMVVMPEDDSHKKWVVHIQAGGGIVADSEPDAEHQETVNKAAALAKAVSLAELAFGE